MDDYKVKHIPANFENGINILGLSFRPIFLIEGVILAVLAFIGFFALAKGYLGMTDVSQIIGIALVFSGILFFLGVKGINDEPITTFIINVIFFAKHKRTCFYNPRIKREAVFFFDEEAREAVPKERILSFFEKKKQEGIKKNSERAKDIIDETVYNPDYMRFKDDLILEENEKERKRKSKKNNTVNTK